MTDMSEIPALQVWRERLEALAGRRKDTALVAVVVAATVFVSLGMWARGAPASIAPPARAAPSPTPGSSIGGVVVVHVAGAVRHPGIIELPAGARVADAIELVGGALPRADLDGLNLAALVADGMQILVALKGTVESAGTAPVPAPSGVSTIDLNTADQMALETLPGIGPVTAAAIVTYRTEIGGFESIDQLLEVTG
ncbi:MAG: ComEA family DNA-binding protein, partial [Actinobacteria bacterium]|nr:ComEA family DNA-binding protein [Actinomycetota bacterium]